MLLNIKKIYFFFFKGYKKFFSPLWPSLALIFPVACKFYPTCSDYSREAVDKYGIAKGIALSTKRFLRCNPLNKGGVDTP